MPLRGCHVLCFILGAFFLAFALLLVHAPFYAEVMWKPPYVNPNTGSFSIAPLPPGPPAQPIGNPWPGFSFTPGPVPNQDLSYVPTAPTCEPGNLFFTLSYPTVANRTCTPGLGGDLTCRAWSRICDSYCQAYNSQATPPVGYCVNGTDSPCWKPNAMFPLSATCLTDPYYVPPNAHRYPTGRSAATEIQTAKAVMEYYLHEFSSSGNGRILYVRGLSYWRIMLLVSPFYFLLVLPFTVPYWSGALHTLLLVWGLCLSFFNFIQSWVWLWTLTSLAADMIRPSTLDATLATSQWVFTGASMVVSGQWFMTIAQTIFVVLLVRYLRSVLQPNGSMFAGFGRPTSGSSGGRSHVSILDRLTSGQSTGPASAVGVGSAGSARGSDYDTRERVMLPGGGVVEATGAERQSLMMRDPVEPAAPAFQMREPVNPAPSSFQMRDPVESAPPAIQMRDPVDPAGPTVEPAPATFQS